MHNNCTVQLTHSVTKQSLSSVVKLYFSPTMKGWRRVCSTLFSVIVCSTCKTV